MKPQPKVAAGGIAGTLAVLVLLIARTLDFEMDAAEGAAIATFVCFAVGYFKKA